MPQTVCEKKYRKHVQAILSTGLHANTVNKWINASLAGATKRGGGGEGAVFSFTSFLN
jgi:hypothetical protein